MKYVINGEYGGFRIPEEILPKIPEAKWKYDDSEEIRTNPELIGYVLNNPDCDLVVVEIPDNATDWRVNEYDGAEDVICVVNGKLCGAEEVEILD